MNKYIETAVNYASIAWQIVDGIVNILLMAVVGIAGIELIKYMVG